MAWGYESSFIVEHDQTLRKNINCKDCIYYESDDKTCRKRPLYLPHDGYNSWKHCKYFELDKGAINYIDKKEKYASVLRRKEVIRNHEKERQEEQKTHSQTVNNNTQSIYQKTRQYRLEVYTDKKPSKITRSQRIVVTTKAGTQRQVKLLLDDNNKKAYISGFQYSQEIIDKIKNMLQK